MPPRAATSSEPLQCRICGEQADGQHFGADACRACAAFYRRTIARNLKYVCRFNNQCEISQSYRCMCRSCRWAKCESVGMKREAVQQSRVPVAPPAKSTRSHLKRKSTTENKLISPQSSSSSSNYDPNATSSQPLYTDYPQESPTTASISQKLKSLQAIIEKSKKTIIINPNTLPVNYPNLAKMLYGYEELQRLRDVQFCRSTDVGGVSTRTFVERELEMTTYVEMMYAEVANVAQMLNLFHGFNDLPSAEKVVLYKIFWISFTILERCFDTYRVLGPNMNDNRMVFSDGSIVNVMLEERIKTENAVDGYMKSQQLYSLIRPWFRLAVELLCPLVKQLQPSPLEMAFCYGMMFYGCDDQLSPLYSETRTSERVPISYTLTHPSVFRVSSSTLEFMHQMTRTLYSELNAYYQTEQPTYNIVERVGELMRFISKTERMVWHRKEDILMTKTFNIFKIDIYLENLFNET